MGFRLARWMVCAVACVSVAAHGASSACNETNVGIQLRDIALPENPRNSDDVVNALGPPFFASTFKDPTHDNQTVDMVEYVDGFFRGRKTVKKSAADVTAPGFSSDREGCGVAIVYKFWGNGTYSKTLRALTVEDIEKAQASQAADTTWATAP